MTDTGRKYEEVIENLLLNESNLNFESQVFIGTKPNNKIRHCVDIFLKDTEEVISLKYQNVAGTAEEKIPYEVVVLQHLANKGKCKSSTIVLSGNGWTQKEWYLEDDFCTSINCPDVQIIEHNDFITKYINSTENTVRGLEGLLQ